MRDIEPLPIPEAIRRPLVWIDCRLLRRHWVEYVSYWDAEINDHAFGVCLLCGRTGEVRGSRFVA